MKYANRSPKKIETRKNFFSKVFRSYNNKNINFIKLLQILRFSTEKHLFCFTLGLDKTGFYSPSEYGLAMATASAHSPRSAPPTASVVKHSSIVMAWWGLGAWSFSCGLRKLFKHWNNRCMNTCVSVKRWHYLDKGR